MFKNCLTYYNLIINYFFLFNYIMNSDYIIWIILLGTLFIIIGLYMSEETPLKISEKSKILNSFGIEEGFSNKSSSREVEEGANPRYKWGLPGRKYNVYSEESDSDDDVPEFKPKKHWYIPPDNDNLPNCVEQPKYDKETCKNCDITMNKDIDKYILKSSVPACPDMSEYAKKNMIQTCPDITNYILKSDIPACEKVDLSKYVLKSEIPASPDCPICPECPVCPVCPAQPDMSKYILKSDIPNSQEVKDLINSKYVEKDKCSTAPVPAPTPTPAPAPAKPSEPAPVEQEKPKPVDNKNTNSNNSNSNSNNTNSNNANKNSNLIGDVVGLYAGDSLFAPVQNADINNGGNISLGGYNYKADDFNKEFEKNFKNSNMNLKNDVTGLYAGDSLFAQF